MVRPTWIIGAVGLVALPVGANAAIVYEYLAKPASLIANVGDTPAFELYLRETVSGSDTSFINSDSGMGGVGFSIAAVDASNHAVTITSLVGNTTDFDTGTLPQYDPATNSVVLVELMRSTGVKGTANGNVREVYLGTLTLKANSLGATTFTVGPVPEVYGNTFTIGSFVDLDWGNDGTSGGPVFAGASATPLYVVVPEPETVGLALGVIGLALAPRKRAPMARD